VTKEEARCTNRNPDQYETKKYKTGLKTADAILKKYPEHGETMCMKGLLLGSLNQRTEGLELAKQGVRYDLTSFIAWHTLGILNRMAKNYNESIKCYLQALKIEGGSNANLIRESAYLYLQLREYSKLVDARRNLVRMQPHYRMNWIGLIVALHLGKDYTEALRVLEQFELIHRDIPKRSFEQSELYLYHAQVLLEAERPQDTIDYLAKKSKEEILDHKSADLLRANAMLKLGDQTAAEKVFESLINRNEEEKSYLHGWLTAKGIATIAKSDEDRTKASEAFEYLQSTFPTSRAVKRIAFVYIRGQRFIEQASVYIGTALQKGIPSIFSDVKSLYGDDEKRRAIEDIVEGYRLEWQAQEAVPSSYLWAIYFLAQHYSFLRQPKRALAYIDSAIVHSPTMPELHMTRARILKRGGSLVWASHAMEDGRLLDGQDRFLNGKAAKYLLRIGEVDEARERMGMFTKPDAPDPVSDLLEMQATWYLLEEERAWTLKGKYAMALKRCSDIDKTFTDIWDDQLDFHSYCLRKSTLRAYISMVRFEDGLHTHPVYLKTATDAISICLRLHDDPSLQKPEKPVTTNGISKEAKKKAAQKAKKQQLKAAEEAKKAAAAAAAKVSKADDEDTPLPTKDEDVDGEIAFAALQPLVEAQRYLTVLQKMAASRIETWLLTFEVAYREKNWLLATSALAHAYKLDSSNAQVHLNLVKLKSSLPALEAAPEAIGKSIEQVLSTMIPSEVSLAHFNTIFLQQHSDRADVVLAAARASVLIDASAKQSAIAAIIEIPRRAGLKEEDADFNCTLVDLDGCRMALKEIQADEATLDTFDRLCSEAYPMADQYKTQEQKSKEEETRKAERLSWDTAKADGEPQSASGNSITAITNGHHH
jgi:hypothetical protein